MRLTKNLKKKTSNNNRMMEKDHVNFLINAREIKTCAGKNPDCINT